jgi:hypothetical protein
MAEKMVILGIGQLMTWLKKCFTWHWTTHDMAEKMFHLTLDNS